MINQRIESFLKANNLTMSPFDYRRKKDESYVNRKFGSKIYHFHDTNAVEHYMLNGRDYRRKTLRVSMAFDYQSNDFPSVKRIKNLKKIIREYVHKNRILSEKIFKSDVEYVIEYEILFTSNNDIRSYQYWIDELAYIINENTNILFNELSLDICLNPYYKKVIPHIRSNQFNNSKINELKDNLDKLNNFELATIGSIYEKEEILPPYDLAIELEFNDEFFRVNHAYYANERSVFAHDFLEKVRHAEILEEEDDNSSIIRR